VSSRRGVAGIEKAADRGIPVEVVPRNEIPDAVEFSARCFEFVRTHRAELVCLAGFLSLLRIPEDFRGRVLNIHPALLPSFGGKGFYGHRVHEAVLAAGVKVSGATVHFVDDRYDAGPIVMQACVPVLEDDTPDTLAARVFAEECRIYPRAVRRVLEGRVTISGNRAVIREDP
jgi:phosphoribosylglycinamide formyltransferase-1